MVEESDAFTDAERQQITDLIYELMQLDCNDWFIIKAAAKPLNRCRRLILGVATRSRGPSTSRSRPTTSCAIAA